MATIAKKIDDVTGQTQNGAAIKEQFQFLQKMADAKCAEFKAELEKMYMGDGTEKTQIVGNRAMRYYMNQHVDIKSGCSEAIDNAVNSFFKGNAGLKDGFKSLISAGLQTAINSTSIGESKEDMFFVYPENLAIVRLDVKWYKYSFSNKGLIADCENVFCYTMSKSIVDHTKLTVDELVYLVSVMSGSDNSEIVGKFVAELVSLWRMLEGVNSETVANNYQVNMAREATPLIRGANDKILLSNINSYEELIEKARQYHWDKAGNYLFKYTKEGITYLVSLYQSLEEVVKTINNIESPYLDSADDYKKEIESKNL